MPMGSACIGNPTISIHTALAGCDAVLGHSNVNTTMISIHTTTQVVTLSVGLTLVIAHISIHTTTQVVTHPVIIIHDAIAISIHTTTQVVTSRTAPRPF